MLLLDHVGAKSGKRRTTPLVYMPDGENFLIVAAKGGHPENPSWLHNLRVYRDTEIHIGRRHIQVHAREADPTNVSASGRWRRPTTHIGATTNAAPIGRSRS
jgi:deazaflavin-dependent oxidoreductase (nitroreductase family)